MSASHYQAAFSAPHANAAQIGLEVLARGGSAVDAMVAAAAAISLLYPHMNSLAGDGFWLIHVPGKDPVAIDACGFAAREANPDWYANQGVREIPQRGPLACVTLGGTLAGWQCARDYSASWQPSLPLTELLAPAIALAEQGIMVSHSLAAASRKVAAALVDEDEYRRVFMPHGRPLVAGEMFSNPGISQLLRALARDGLDSFYRGPLARHMARALAQRGSPLRLGDFHDYRAQRVAPLSVTTSQGQCFNLPAPTQGIASLLILALYDRHYCQHRGAHLSQSEKVHQLIEATKQAFRVRDRELADPAHLSERWPQLLDDAHIDSLARAIGPEAAPWPYPAEPGDTVWMGCVDRRGVMVSFIQSLYWEFGAGLVIPELGLVWNNRGVSFSLDASARNQLRPRTKPSHTLNPALALLNDGRRLSYGTMGGEGQPQTQAALFSRYVYDQLPLAEAIARGRWLLGRTWGDAHYDLKMEEDLLVQVGGALRARGHSIKPVPVHSELMGHAGAVVSFASGTAEAASDPRSDGAGLVSTIDDKGRGGKQR